MFILFIRFIPTHLVKWKLSWRHHYNWLSRLQFYSTWFPYSILFPVLSGFHSPNVARKHLQSSLASYLPTTWVQGLVILHWFLTLSTINKWWSLSGWGQPLLEGKHFIERWYNSWLLHDTSTLYQSLTPGEWCNTSCLHLALSCTAHRPAFGLWLKVNILSHTPCKPSRVKALDQWTIYRLNLPSVPETKLLTTNGV